MASSKSKTIDEIDDMGDMLQAMTSLNISCKGMKTLQQMKDRVKKLTVPVSKEAQLDCRTGILTLNTKQ